MRKQSLVVLVAVMMGFLILSPNTTNATSFTLTGSVIDVNYFFPSTTIIIPVFLPRMLIPPQAWKRSGA